MVDIDAAISQCGGELFNIFEMCFGRSSRNLKCFNYFKSEYVLEGAFAHKDKKMANGLMLSFLNFFGSIGGFDSVLSFIRFELKDQKYSI